MPWLVIPLNCHMAVLTVKGLNELCFIQIGHRMAYLGYSIIYLHCSNY